MLKHPGDLQFHLNQTATVLREICVDFMYRFNDKYPFNIIDNDNLLCNSSQEGEMDVYDVIMDFLIPSGYFPSAALLKEYSQSETTKTLNIFPTIEYLNKKFKRNISEENYNRMKERYLYYSIPAFIYFFNPSVKLRETCLNGWSLKSGYYKRGTTDVSMVQI